MGKISTLNVGDNRYVGENVPDGFYESISRLKMRNEEKLCQSEYFKEFTEDYHHILELCKESAPLRPLSEAEALNLLNRMKPNVPDFFSITPLHYLYAGTAGVKHFTLLINELLKDVSNIDIREVNRAHAIVLFKGHGKDKTSASSYRTISSCPVVAKALDLHIHDLHIREWDNEQASTQFQGQGSSHELAGLLLSECIEFSKSTLKSPIYVLYLDARSAFDLVQRELLVRNLFFAQATDQSILHIDSRLAHRETVVDFDGHLMGPISDQQGLEQGGISSSDLFKIYAKEQLTLSQNSSLGVPLGNLIVSAIGQADDTVLISNDIVLLSYLLILTKTFCQKSLVELSAEKTKLQVFNPEKRSSASLSTDLFNPIEINGKTIPFTENAEHVGILRCTKGNGPALYARFSAHRKAIGAVLHQGMARGHRANPCFSLQIEKLYATPVLFSGLGALILSKKECDSIEYHYRESLRNILRLHRGTPRCVIYFLAGSLPGKAILHLRQLSLFGMIVRKKGSILNTHALNIFNNVTVSNNSWFHGIHQLCNMYDLPHPVHLLEYPLEKLPFKKFIRSKVVSYWELVLRQEAANLKSIPFFNASYMSLSKIHPLLNTVGHSPYHVAKSLIQSIMLSGRYRCGALLRHWKGDYEGRCLLSPECVYQLEDVPHILQHCPALGDIRESLFKFTHDYTLSLPVSLHHLLLDLCHPSSSYFCQFLLDCS